MRLLGLYPPGRGFWVRWPDRHVTDLDGYARYWNELAVSWSFAAQALGAEVLRYEDLVGGRADLAALGERLGLALKPAIALAVRSGATPNPTPPPPDEAARVNALTAEGRAALNYGD